MCLHKIKSNSKRLMKRAGLVTTMSISLGLTGVLSSASVSFSAYSDPLDIPSVKMEAAQNSLLLDVEYAGKRLVTVGERGHIIFSDDQGQSWIQSNVSSMAHLNAVFFINSKLGWAVGEDQVIMRSEDGGENWNRIYDNRTAEVVAPLLDVLFLDEKNGFAIGAYGTILSTSDSGESWENIGERIDNIDEWHYNAITKTMGGSLYIAGEKGFVYRSDDDGNSWQVIRIPRELTPEEVEDMLEPYHEVSFLGVIPTNEEQRLVFFGVGGRVFITDDGGLNWRQAELNTTAGIAGGSLDENGSLIMVGSDGVIIRGDSKATEFSVYVREDRLPLTAVKPVGGGKFVTVGIAGIFLSSLDELDTDPTNNQ